MLIMLVLILLAPALISVALYEQFKGNKLQLVERVALALIFAFVINMGVYAAVWLRGWNFVDWTLYGSPQLTNVQFSLKYMALSLVFAVVLPFVFGLVKIGKRK